MRYLLDTNIVIAWLVRGDRTVGRKMIEEQGHLALSTIVMHELYFGAFNSSRLERNLAELKRINVSVLAFGDDDARTAGEIRTVLKRRGTPIGPYDVLIASQALARDLTLVTANVDEFARVEGLKIADWTTP